MKSIHLYDTKYFSILIVKPSRITKFFRKNEEIEESNHMNLLKILFELVFNHEAKKIERIMAIDLIT